MHIYTLQELHCIIICVITVPSSDVAARRKEVKQLIELVASEFQAVKLELEASRLDVDSIRCALFEVVAKQSNKAVAHTTIMCLL